VTMISILRVIAGKALRGDQVSLDERGLFNIYVRDHSLTPSVVQCADHPIQAVLLMDSTEDASPFIRSGTGWKCHICLTSDKVSVRAITSI
jgi:hypothetical protein